MKKSSTASITSLPPSPADERHKRVVEYSLMMGLRVVCFLVCVLLYVLHVPFVWILIPAMGAVFLPYFAVVTANAVQGGAPGNDPERPGSVEMYLGQRPAAGGGQAAGSEQKPAEAPEEHPQP